MPARPTLGSHTSRRRTPNRAFATPSRCVGTSANVEHAGIHTVLYWVPYTGCPTEMSRNLRLLGEAGGQPGKWLTLAWLLTQLGVHRVQVADTSQDLPSYRSPAWFSGMGGDGRGGEERRVRLQLCFPPGSVLGPLPRPHAPQGWANVLLPESLWYLSSRSCFASTQPSPARSWGGTGGGGQEVGDPCGPSKGPWGSG